MAPDAADLWRLLPLGYCLSVALETPVLLFGLAPRHPIGRKLLCGLWLTACTYPIVILVLPALIWRPLGPSGYWPYVVVAELFAPLAECALFWLAFWRTAHSSQPQQDRRDLFRDMLAIIAANLCSFLIGGRALPFIYS
jgi:hypothetical protein